MTPIPRPLLPVLLLILALAPFQRARADAFTPAQRDEVVAILRDALKRDPSILRDAVAAMQADEQRRSEQAASDAIGKLGPALVEPTDPVEGNPAGTVTMVEFYDTRCPYCRSMLPEMAELIREEPNLRLVLKDLPILGPVSTLESRALLAAQRQGGYFKLRDALMASTAPSTPDSIRAAAERLDLDGAKLLRDMDDPSIKARLDANVALARRIGIGGTPAMIVGRQLLAGAASVAEMRQAIAGATKPE